MSTRVLIWVQHLLGTGHLRRALTLAEALAARGASVTVASGGAAHPWRPSGAIRFVQLPAIRAEDPSFARLIGADGEVAGRALWAARARRLQELFEGPSFAAVVTELFPFGRGAFSDEVVGVLAAARGQSPPALIVASVRDVLVSKRDPAKRRRMLETAIAWYDRVLIHGDEALIGFAESFPEADQLGNRLVHTGYLTAAAPAAATLRPDKRTGVVVSAGGGRVGQRLLATAIAACGHSSEATGGWHLLAGPAVGAEGFAQLLAAATPRLRLERHRDDLTELLGRAAVAVSQAGYNTVAETLQAGPAMVLVPFATAVENEQIVHAQRLQERGLAELLPDAALGPVPLAQAVDRALERGPSNLPKPDLGGAARSAELVLALLASRTP